MSDEPIHDRLLIAPYGGYEDMEQRFPARRCTKCGDRIPAARIEALPETDTCVDCSDVAPRTEADLPPANDGDEMRSTVDQGENY